LAATHPSPFNFLPHRTGNEASAAARAAQRPITPENQGGTNRARQTGSSHHDHRDHISTGRNDTMALPSCRSSPSESRRPSVKGKVRQVSPQRSQPAKPAEQLWKSSRKIVTPEPATAQMSQQALEQARHVLQVIEASAHSCEHTASSSTFSISPAAMLDLLANEFNNHDPEDGRYATTQHRQEAENSPATTGEFNRMLNMVVNEVRQPHTDKETSSAYARCRAAQERLSQSVPTLCEHVKAEPVAPPPVNSAYSCSHQLREEFCDRVALQRLRLSDLQADGHTPVPDQGVIFDQNGIPRDSHDLRLRRDPTHEPTEPGSPPLEYRDGPDGGDGSDGSDPSSHGDSRSQLSRHSSRHSSAARSLRFETRRLASCRSSRSRPPSCIRSCSSWHDDRRSDRSSHRRRSHSRSRPRVRSSPTYPNETSPCKSAYL
jgi:hypothetical protein